MDSTSSKFALLEKCKATTKLTVTEGSEQVTGILLNLLRQKKHKVTTKLTITDGSIQVTGYVLIMNVHAYHVPLTSLQVIRGKTLFRYPKLSDQYSLFVALNYDKNSELGLKELRFSSLRGWWWRWWWWW